MLVSVNPQWIRMEINDIYGHLINICKWHMKSMHCNHYVIHDAYINHFAYLLCLSCLLLRFPLQTSSLVTCKTTSNWCSVCIVYAQWNVQLLAWQWTSEQQQQNIPAMQLRKRSSISFAITSGAIHWPIPPLAPSNDRGMVWCLSFVTTYVLLSTRATSAGSVRQM